MRQFLAVAALLVCTSCATMVNGRYQEVTVDSFPSGATIMLDCGGVPHDAGRTPALLKLPRAAKQCQATFAKEGYDDRVVVFERQMSRAVGANRVVAAPVAIVVGLVGFVLGDYIGAPELAAIAWEVGIEAGSAPGRQYDKHTGGAYKWVPGDAFVTLVRAGLPE